VSCPGRKGPSNFPRPLVRGDWLGVEVGYVIRNVRNGLGLASKIITS